MAKKSHSAPNRMRPAGSKTDAPISFTSSNLFCSSFKGRCLWLRPLSIWFRLVPRALEKTRSPRYPAHGVSGILYRPNPRIRHHKRDIIMRIQIMKIRRLFPVLALAIICASVTPAFGVSKEIVQLQTQVDNLQAQMSRLQQSLDES